MESAFKPEFTKKKFQIVIDVYENCQTLTINRLPEERDVTYHEIIGSLEIQKTILIHDQSEYNRKMSKRRKNIE